MKVLLDYLWAPFFFGGYLYGGIYVATAALIATTWAMVVLWWLWKRGLNRTYLAVAVITSILGGITLYVHDPVFIKLKPSAVYLVFSGALLGSHVAGDRVLMARLLQHVLTLPDALWRRINLAWAVFFVGLAALNWYVAGHYDEATWVKFKVFGFTALTFVFAMAHVPFLWRYLPQE